MPNLLAMSFEGDLAPSFDLLCLKPNRPRPDGWGLGWYPGGEPASVVLKEPAPPAGSIRSKLVEAWEHLESSLFVLHIRTATWGAVTDANTQPFVRSHGGRDWMCAHSGSLDHRLALTPRVPFEPVGSTDTELIFCDLLARFAARGWRSLGEVDAAVLSAWFAELNAHGSMTMVLTDGHDLVVYADAQGHGPVHMWELHPPYGELAFGDQDLHVDLARRGVKPRRGVILSSGPLPATEGVHAHWRTLPWGSLVVIRQGEVVQEVAHDPDRDRQILGAQPTPTITERVSPAIHIPMRRSLVPPTQAEVRRLEILHRTTYRYTQAVERSIHLMRLQPIHDHLQKALISEITFSADGEQREYEDVFGNRVRKIYVEKPFEELIIEAKSEVAVLDTDPLGLRLPRHRAQIPLVWMPWQRQVLQPYLLPPELPESELVELIEYAMTFVKRNDFDLLDTLLDMNLSIFKDYEYKQGATSLSTTPFEVYCNRFGVCQDFANLFICLARLLGVPARYTCGYIYTGPKNPNHAQSEASHAWVQVYLPEVGWKGFDPTNGVVTQTDHVRVAVGRNYVDATPTSGTIFVGGGGETMDIEVRCEIVEDYR